MGKNLLETHRLYLHTHYYRQIRHCLNLAIELLHLEKRQLHCLDPNQFLGQNNHLSRCQCSPFGHILRFQAYCRKNLQCRCIRLRLYLYR